MEEYQTGTCVICGQSRRDGIRIISAFLCDDCESVLVHTDVKDSRYSYFVYQMRQILYQING
jgi:hypothetical protein